MGARGELFTTQIYLDNRSYFFNVKENRTGDVFLQIVESKNRDGAEADRHQIAIFADDMQKFLQGMEKSLEFVEKDRKARQKAAKEKKAAKEAKYGKGAASSSGKKVYRMKSEKTETKKPRLHVVSKKADAPAATETNTEE
ncbi:MAG: PUR family DNA/RNA-binding protein [Treponema sp.]|nr:PUR family DNA/RNA-binding protein [Treponema sp.]